MATSAADLAARREALLQAQQRFLAWLDGHAVAPSQQPDRLAFNRLAKATAEMDAALRAFSANAPNRANRVRLLALLQGGQALQPQVEYQRMLDGLIEPLMFIQAAAVEGGGRGQTTNMHAAVWVSFAADCWVQRGFPAPSAAERGMFWRALADFNHDGRAHRVPSVGRDGVASALKSWRARREAWGG